MHDWLQWNRCMQRTRASGCSPCVDITLNLRDCMHAMLRHLAHIVAVDADSSATRIELLDCMHACWIALYDVCVTVTARGGIASLHGHMSFPHSPQIQLRLPPISSSTTVRACLSSRALMCTAVESVRIRAKEAAAKADKTGLRCATDVFGDDLLQRRRHVR